MNIGDVIIFFTLLSLLAPTEAVMGVDVSQPSSVFSCMKQNGASFAITRGYCSYGGVDANGVQNLKNAKAAGLIADTYVFPCRGKSADAQMAEFVSYFDARGEVGLMGTNMETNESDNFPGMQAGRYDEFSTQPTEERFLEIEPEQTTESNYTPTEIVGQLYGTVWLDVEINPSSGCSWASYSAASNCQHLGELVQGLKKRGKLVGIYSSRYMWETVMGSSGACANFKDLPVWYAHYDGVASFSDWNSVSFGGWTKPAIKQYLGDKSLCGLGVDFNFY